MYFLMMRTIKYAETAIFLAVMSASTCAIGEECGWRRVCEVPETQIECEETPSHVRSLSRLVGALDIGLSNGLPASDFGRIKELARALDHDPDKCYRYVRDNIAYASYAGLLKGPERTLLDREGNELDQSFLLLALLRASGFTDAGIGYAPLATSNGTGHALDRMQERGLTPKVVESAIQNSTPIPSKNATFIHSNGSVKVIVNENGTVVTAMPQ